MLLVVMANAKKGSSLDTASLPPVCRVRHQVSLVYERPTIDSVGQKKHARQVPAVS